MQSEITKLIKEGKLKSYEDTFDTPTDHLLWLANGRGVMMLNPETLELEPVFAPLKMRIKILMSLLTQQTKQESKSKKISVRELKEKALAALKEAQELEKSEEGWG